MANDIIDLTAEATTIAQTPADEDRLTKLPSELLHNIFDYLFVRHQPDELHYYSPKRDEYGSRCNHELDMLAATCRILRSEINDWATHFLVQHQDITRYKPPKQPRKDKTFNALRARGGQGLLSWTDRHCVMCGKTSSRAAIMVNGLKCCKACDAKHWPKITKTEARKEYDLKAYNLLPHSPYADQSEIKELEERFPDGIPRIHYGTYDAMGVTARAFLREDVEWLASIYHGDLEAHLGVRRSKLECKRQKKKDKAAAKYAAEQAAAAKARVERKGPAIGATASVPYVLDDD